MAGPAPHRHAQHGEGAPRRPFSRFPTFALRLLLAAGLVIGTSGCLVGNPSSSARWKSTTPTPRTTSSTAIAYGPLPAQRFDLFTSRAASNDGRTIVFVHGGAWSGGDRTQVPPLVRDLARDGWNIMSISYRLTCSDPADETCASARFVDQIADVKLAVRYVKAHAADLGLDARRVVLAGYSAGGHLATVAALSVGAMEPPDAQMDAATRAADSSVRGYVSFSGPTDLSALLASQDQLLGAHLAPSAAMLFPTCVVQPDQTATCDPAEVAPANAAAWLDLGDPGGYVFAGGADTLVPAATQAAPFEAFATLFTGDAGRVWLDIGETAGHDGFASVNFRALRDWLQSAVR